MRHYITTWLRCIVIITLFLGFGVWWTTYKYRDCRLVGHTKLYCIMRLIAE